MLSFRGVSPCSLVMFTDKPEKCTCSVFRLKVFLFFTKLEVTCCSVTSTLKIEAASSSETSVNMYQTTLRHISEDNNLQCITFVLIYSLIYVYITMPCVADNMQRRMVG
jgi:hypothetical protein